MFPNGSRLIVGGVIPPCICANSLFSSSSVVMVGASGKAMLFSYGSIDGA